MMPEKAKLRKFFAWCVIAACFVGMPALLVFTAIGNYCQLAENERQIKIKIGLQQAINESTRNIDPEKFWGRKLGETFSTFARQQSHTQESIEWLQDLYQKYPGYFDYLVWNKQGQIIAQTCVGRFSPDDWLSTFYLLSSLNYDNGPGWHKQQNADIEAVRRVLGPQFVHNMVEDNIKPKSYGFAWTDSAHDKPLVWSYFTSKTGYLLFLNKKILSSTSGLHESIRTFSQNKEQKYGIFYPNATTSTIWPPELRQSFSELPRILYHCENELKNFYETGEYYLAFGFLNPETRIFVCSGKKFTSGKKLYYSLLGALFLCTIMAPFLLYTWQTMVKDIPGSISIRSRIAFVFFFACSVPILTVTIFAKEHYSQKRHADLKHTHQLSLALLQNYDARMESLTSRFEFQMKNFLETWAGNLQGQTINSNNNAALQKKCRELIVESYFLVCSHTPLVGSYNGVDHFSETLQDQQKTKDRIKIKNSEERFHRNSDPQNSQVANIIGKRIMSELNGQSHDNKDADRMELLFESLLQKSFSEITHSFIKAMGGISPWGFGQTMNMALLNFMSAKGSATIDFMALVIWSGPGIQREYIKRTINEVNRNPLGLKIVVRNRVSDHEIFPADYVPTFEQQAFLQRLTDQPTEEIEILTINNEEYMGIGFNGKHLTRYQLLGLYPISLLERKIARQRSDLILLATFCILLASWLAQLLAQSFLTPLNHLQSAAMAIEKREFAFRISDTGKDEFGEVASIFNDVIVSLEELEVAKVVQESLFPETAMQCGGFRVYGRSLAMAELGGDYFDYFAVDNQHMAALMGDVAGHGIGAALIMAMAKAGVIKSHNYLKQPVKILENLHELIYSSKTRKQKKIMTFQYICAEVGNGKVTYANAGGCSPIFVCKEKQEAREITLTGAALGAFKKARYNETIIQFAPGDLMVFYTDGIIEARNLAGSEFGYEAFANLVKESWHENPQEVYNRISDDYMRHITGMEAQDDLTMVIICYTG